MRIRRRLLLASSLALIALFIVSGHGQTAAPRRTLVASFAPPPIERGIIPDRSRAPRSRDALRRQSIRAASRIPDRYGASGARYANGRVIVKFKDGISAATRLAVLPTVSRTGTMTSRALSQNFDIVQTADGEDAEATARAFRARGDVEYAQAAYRVYPLFVPNDAFYPMQWNLPLLDMERAWDIQRAAGSAITVAVVDTGIAYGAFTMNYTAGAFSVDAAGDVNPPGSPGTAYPALGNLRLSFVAATELQPLTRFVAPHDFIWNDATPVDLDGHGTHVSGTLGQLTNNGANGQGDTAHGGGTAGVAFDVKLMPVKVLSTEWDDIFGSPNVGTDDVVALGIRYAADNGAKIINLSLGRTGPSGCGPNPNQDGCAPVVEDAIKYAVSKGCFIAIAAGNDFDNGNPTEVLAEIASRVNGAVSVAAVNEAKGHAFYSSTGSWVELAAPGGEFGTFGDSGGILQQTLNLDLVTTFDSAPSQFIAPRFDSLAYFYFIGTSQPTPHVSGVAAMLMQQGITSPAAIEAALERFATPCSESTNTCDASLPAVRTSTFGFGLVEARNTLRGLGVAR